MAGWYVSSRTLRGDSDAEQVDCAEVSPAFFRVFGVPAALGRAELPPGQAGASFNIANEFQTGGRYAVLSHALWRTRYGGDSAVIGRTIRLDGLEWEVVAVMPPGFETPGRRSDLWAFWDMHASYAPPRFPAGPPHSFRFLEVMGRLAPEVSLPAAREELAAIAAALAAEYPSDNEGWSARADPFTEEDRAPARPLLAALSGAAALVLVLAAVNAASLLMARASARSQETAVRAALGASRARLARQGLLEGLLLGAAGGIAGVALASMLVRALPTLAPDALPPGALVRLDFRALAFAVVAAIGAGLAAGAGPAAAAAASRPARALRSVGRGAGGSRTDRRLRAVLVAVQVAIAAALLTAAALLGSSVRRLQALDPGFDARNLVVGRIYLETRAYSGPGKATEYYRTLLEQLAAHPSVAAAGASTVLPMGRVGIDFTRPAWAESDGVVEGKDRPVSIRMATPGYFPAVGMRLKEGRGPSPDDRWRGPRVIAVNEAAARMFFPGRRAIGERLVIDYQGGRYPYEVVGVVGDTLGYGPREATPPEVFIPHAANPYLAMNVVLRAKSGAAPAIAALREAVARQDRWQPLHSVTTMDALRESFISRERLAAALFSVLGTLSILLAAGGLFGLLSYSVALRSIEIGIRMAVGATPGRLVGMVVGEGMRLAVAGCALGLLSALATAGALASLLYPAGRLEWTAFCAAASILLAAAAAACWLPARRALRVDPASALSRGSGA
jgi:predicted permease